MSTLKQLLASRSPRAAGVSKKWPKRCCLKRTCISCGKR